MNSFAENINYISGLDHSYGYEVNINKSNISTYTNIYDIKLELNVLDKNTYMNSTINIERLAVETSTLALSLQSVIDEINTNTYLTASYTSAINNVFAEIAINIVSNDTDKILNNCNMNIYKDNVLTYEINGYIDNSIKILPLVATLDDDIAESIILVGENSTNITTVASNIDNINTVAENIDNVVIVAENIDDVNRVSQSSDNVDRISISADKIDRVYESIDEIDRVYVSSDNIDRVYTSITNVDRTSASANHIDRVYLSIDNIDTVKNSIDNVDTVANNIINVNITSENIDNINATLVSLDQFNDRFLGNIASDPAGEEGQLYYNTVLKRFKLHDGTAWTLAYVTYEDTVNIHDIGVTVQPYDADTVTDADYVHTDNNYTTDEKNKLSGIADGAEVNVNADWIATSGDAEILNKPTTVSGYGITDAYTKTEVDTEISTAINGLIDTAPATLDTLNELAAALGDDANFATTVTTSIGTKVSKAGDTMTGDLTVPNIIVTGNVDGRDISVDGAKLDTIEPGSKAVNDTVPSANPYSGSMTQGLHDSQQTDIGNIVQSLLALKSTSAQGEFGINGIQLNLSTTEQVMPFNVITQSTNTDVFQIGTSIGTVKEPGTYSFISTVEVEDTGADGAVGTLTFNLRDTTTNTIYYTQSSTIEVSNNDRETIPFNSLMVIPDTMTLPVTIDINVVSNISGYRIVGFKSILSASTNSASITTEHNELVNRDASGSHPASAITNTPSGSLEATTVQDALNEIQGNIDTLNAKDINITLTGDVTGTGTITNLGDVSFATTIASNSVELGVDTVGNYVSDIEPGSGISVTGTEGEGWTATITNTAPNITTDISITHNSDSISVNSSDGTDGTINGATSSLAGAMIASDKVALDKMVIDITAVHIDRADKYLAAQAVANMVYTNGKLTKVQYNNATDVEREVLAYDGTGKLVTVQHYTASTLRGTTTLSYTDGKLVSAIYAGV